MKNPIDADHLNHIHIGTEIIWSVTQSDLPILKIEIEKILEELK